MEELAKKTETAEKKGDLLLFVKIQTALVAVLVLLLVVGGIFAAVQVNKAMRVVDGLDMDKINAAVQSLSNTATELEKLDMEVPTNIEELYAYLTAAKEANLGGSKTIP